MGGFSSGHGILKHQADSRVMAAETAIIELMSPLIEVKTWLGYRDLVAKNPSLIHHLRRGADSCFDLGWCHYAKANMTGEQHWPPKGRPRELSFDDEAVKSRSCVVFYQTPLVHVNKRSLPKGKLFNEVSKDVCAVFRDLGVHWAVHNVYEAFISK